MWESVTVKWSKITGELAQYADLAGIALSRVITDTVVSHRVCVLLDYCYGCDYCDSIVTVWESTYHNELEALKVFAALESWLIREPLVQQWCPKIPRGTRRKRR